MVYCRDLEQVAMGRLVELAYKKQLVTFVRVCFFSLLFLSSKFRVTYVYVTIFNNIVHGP